MNCVRPTGGAIGGSGGCKFLSASNHHRNNVFPFALEVLGFRTMLIAQ